MNKKAVSLVEILVATMILAVVMGGLMSAVVSGQRYLLHTRNRISASQAVKSKLEVLYKEVRQDTWSSPSNPLRIPSSTSSNDCGGVTCDAIVATSDKDGLRKVKVDITWREDY